LSAKINLPHQCLGFFEIYNFLNFLDLEWYYDQKSIDSRIKNMRDTLRYNEYLKIKKEYDNLMNTYVSYNKLDNLLDDFDKIKHEIEKITSIEIYESILEGLVEKPDYSIYETVIINNELNLSFIIGLSHFRIEFPFTLEKEETMNIGLLRDDGGNQLFVMKPVVNDDAKWVIRGADDKIYDFEDLAQFLQNP